MTSYVYYNCHVVDPSNLMRGAYFDGTAVLSQSVSVSGQCATGYDTVQSLVNDQDCQGQVFGATNVLLTKKAFASLYEGQLDVRVFRTGAGTDPMDNVAFRYVIYVGTSSDVDMVLEDKSFSFVVGSKYSVLLPSFEKFVIPEGKNLFLRVRLSTSYDLCAQVDFGGRLIVDD